tara:strand:- start:3572 stop:3757 length:186 start_codon:yes stop_codon:yes gene_type:complete
MFKFIKEWFLAYHELTSELNKQGIFTVYHSFGATTHYVDPKITTHINTFDDRQNTVSTKNK